MTKLDDIATAQLVEEHAKFQAKINGPDNDGRLTSDSSNALDYWFDMLDEIETAFLKRWLPVTKYPVRDSVPMTTEVFVVDSAGGVRAVVWRWAGYKKWSWSATDADGRYHEDRPDAPNARLFDTVEQAKRHALVVAGVIGK